ncbi:MAG TPA: NAD(P)(+) transhydrogenase (Re/Si-specific) subunit beta, partial [Enhygromyxa sp.]|nr:NAD(P)(+) transhydrogenase (Re/Si-specific) subunit beta [Enhygromyxa sp.]
MLPAGLLTIAYVAASILFILSLGGLSNQETARRGNLYGIVGMLLAIGATATYTLGGFNSAVPFLLDGPGFGVLAGAVLIGAVIGATMAARVAMTSMPELVAVLHSFVGLAAVLVGLSSYMAPLHHLEGSEKLVHELEIFVDVFIGSITFTGSVIA